MTVKMGTAKGLALAQLGKLLQYPQAEYQSSVKAIVAGVASSFPEAQGELQAFARQCEKLPLSKLEEIYTSTFDLAAICSPYITGYIYGDENYDRGTLMAQFSEKYAEVGFDRQGELPDHLSLLLRFAAWLDEEALGELISYCLLDPVQKMIESLGDSTHLYHHLLSAVLLLLKSNKTGGSHA